MNCDHLLGKEVYLDLINVRYRGVLSKESGYLHVTTYTGKQYGFKEEDVDEDRSFGIVICLLRGIAVTVTQKGSV